MIHGNLKKLSNDHTYCLCMIARIHEVPLNCIIEAEQVLASEFAQADNHVWQKINIESLTVAVLKFICDRHNIVVDFNDFVTRMHINQIHVDKSYRRIADKFKDNHMPRMTVPSTMVFTMLCA